MSDIRCKGDAVSISFENGTSISINRHYIVNLRQLCGFGSYISVQTPIAEHALKVDDCMNVYEQLKKFMHSD